MKMITLPKLRDALRDLQPAGEGGPGDRRARPGADRAHGRDLAVVRRVLALTLAPGVPAGRDRRRRRPRPGRPHDGARPRRHADVRRLGARPPHGRARRPALGHLASAAWIRATAARSATSTARTRAPSAMFRRTGMPAFGPIGSFAGSDEPHAGFKVFVVNDDRKGLVWMMVLHQGSGSPRRGHGALPLARDLAVPRPRGCSRTRALMADFGEPVRELPGRPACARACGCCPTRAASRSTRSGPPRSNVGGVFRGRPGVRDRQRDHAVRPGATPSGWCSTSRSPAARTTRPAGTRTARATSARSSTRAGACPDRGPLALPHRRPRPARRRRIAPGGGAPGARETSGASAAGWRTPS